jgi:hypothetical protein
MQTSEVKKPWDWLETEITQFALRLGYGLEDREYDLNSRAEREREREIFLFSTTSVSSRTHPDSNQWVWRDLSFRVKQLECVADQSHPCSAEDGMCGIIPPLPHGVVMVKHRNNFTFYPSWNLILAYFPYFQEMKWGLRNHLAVSLFIHLCLSVHWSVSFTPSVYLSEFSGFWVLLGLYDHLNVYLSISLLPKFLLGRLWYHLAIWKSVFPHNFFLFGLTYQRKVG